MIFSISGFTERLLALGARAIFLATLVIAGVSLAERPAAAMAVLSSAAANANGGLSACNNTSGKALYDCVANVLDRLSNEVSPAQVPETQRSLQAAASRLRAATSKAQALSAITQCQAAIAGAIRQVKAAGGAYVSGWGDAGLASVAGVLARAAKLIQAKG
jgi:hypothetical protein